VRAARRSLARTGCDPFLTPCAGQPGVGCVQSERLRAVQDGTCRRPLDGWLPWGAAWLGSVTWALSAGHGGLIDRAIIGALAAQGADDVRPALVACPSFRPTPIHQFTDSPAHRRHLPTQLNRSDSSNTFRTANTHSTRTHDRTHAHHIPAASHRFQTWRDAYTTISGAGCTASCCSWIPRRVIVCAQLCRWGSVPLSGRMAQGIGPPRPTTPHGIVPICRYMLRDPIDRLSSLLVRARWSIRPARRHAFEMYPNRVPRVP
jgi:hypothetical protein